MAHHGRRDAMVFYEQVTADGAVQADDCVPALLVAPLLTQLVILAG